MKKGDWVFDGGETIGRVRRDPYDPCGHGAVVDITIYGRDGARVGRLSPAMGGPRHFEPAMEIEHWHVIERPKFPLSRFCYLEEVLRLKP